MVHHRLMFLFEKVEEESYCQDPQHHLMCMKEQDSLQFSDVNQLLRVLLQTKSIHFPDIY